MRTKILILSERDDYHGTAVMWGLRGLGEDKSVVFWDRTRFPVSQQLSTAVRVNGELSFHGGSLNDLFAPGRFKSIWNRRGADPTVSKQLNKADKVVARAESRVFLSSVLSAIERLNPSALIANRNAAAVFAEEKLVQLMTATSVGLTVPPTLISNNAADIRHFYRQEAGAVIAKQHHPFAWRSAEQTLAVPGTSLVTDQHLQSDFSLEGAPVIYQRLLDITHELRVTVFGRSVFAISQTRVHQDFGGIRDIRWEDPIPRFHKLESDIAEKLLMFMSKMNMNFATFDIAVTKNNEQFFLECNEAGQFLFQEVRVPEINVLDAFCKFLSSGDPNFEYKESPRPIKLSDFENTDIAKDFHRVFTENVRKSTRYSPFELLE